MIETNILEVITLVLTSTIFGMVLTMVKDKNKK